MKKAYTKEQKAELKALADMPDEEIDFSDIPEITEWSGAVIGKFFKPIKQSLTVRIDADVIDWLKRSGRGYQTRLNSWLRAEMQRDREQQQKKAA